jgi:alpha-tubulin suppressor-like RCC1 family protein
VTLTSENNQSKTKIMMMDKKNNKHDEMRVVQFKDDKFMENVIPLNKMKLLGYGFSDNFTRSQFIVVVTIDNEIWAVGDNYYGQLGLNDRVNRKEFTLVNHGIEETIAIVSCGSNHTMIVTENTNLIYGTGYNYNGRLGFGDTQDRSTFCLVPFVDKGKITQFACGSYHTILLVNDTDLYVAGRNFYGQLGLGTNRTEQTTFAIAEWKSDGIIGTHIKQVSCGEDHSAILTNCNELLVCGVYKL